MCRDAGPCDREGTDVPTGCNLVPFVPRSAAGSVRPTRKRRSSPHRRPKCPKHGQLLGCRRHKASVWAVRMPGVLGRRGGPIPDNVSRDQLSKRTVWHANAPPRPWDSLVMRVRRLRGRRWVYRLNRTDTRLRVNLRSVHSARRTARSSTHLPRWSRTRSRKLTTCVVLPLLQPWAPRSRLVLPCRARVRSYLQARC